MGPVASSKKLIKDRLLTLQYCFYHFLSFADLNLQKDKAKLCTRIRELFSSSDKGCSVCAVVHVVLGGDGGCFNVAACIATVV